MAVESIARQEPKAAGVSLAPAKAQREWAGFTLLELLVVLGIIVVLLAILLPVLRLVRDNANRAVCASNLRSAGQLIRLYANDNHGEIPAVYAPADALPPPPLENPTLITAYEVVRNGRPTASLLPCVYLDKGGIALLVSPPIGAAKQSYTKSAKVFFCPADDLHTEKKSPDSFGWYPPRMGSPDEHHPFVLGNMSYNYLYVPPGGDRFHYGWRDDPRHWEKGEFAGFERHSISQRGAASTAILSEPRLMGITEWHRSGNNVLYLDGHVGWLVGGNTAPYSSRGPTTDTLTALDKAAR
jgi:prepilin-type N-terminal cleavage/methylation domain-containing protein/prepilin-type processing-associated H-X9-DG protein